MISIDSPRSTNASGGLRYSCRVRSGNSTHELWYLVPSEIAHLASDDRVDCFAVAMIVEAMSRNEELRIGGVVSSTLARGLIEYQHALASRYPALRIVQVSFEEVRQFDSSFDGRSLATGFSAGVDAFYTLYRHLRGDLSGDRIGYLAAGNPGNFPQTPAGIAAYSTYQSYLHTAASGLSLPIAFIDSNISEVVGVERGGFSSRVLSGVLVLQRLFHTYLHQTGVPYCDLSGDTDGCNPLCDHLLSTDATRIVSDGASATRIEKIASLAEWPIALRYLHVCPTVTPEMTNCSRCTKCVATMLAIDMLGKSNEFRKAFDFSLLPAARQEFASRYRKEPSIVSNYLWRELLKYAEQTDYPLLDAAQPRIASTPRTSRIKSQESTQENSGEQTASLLPKPIAKFWLPVDDLGVRLSSAVLTASGYALETATPDAADIVAGGSLLQMLPNDYGGAILGAGFLHEGNYREFPRSTILAVRGRLSAERCRAPASCLLADFGLLAPKLLESPQEVRHTLAIVPQEDEQASPQLRALATKYPKEIVLVDVRAAPKKIVALLAGADYVLSSSLYGLIMADALGKPNRRLLLGDQAPRHDFTFRDYYSAYDAVTTPLGIDGGETLSNVLGQIGAAQPEAADCGEAMAELLAAIAEFAS